MRLEPCGLAGDQRISRGVRAVETIAGELFDHVKNVRRERFAHAVTFRAVDKTLALLRHLFGFFLAHGAAQQIGAAERVAGKHPCNLHHLLLIQDHTVGRLENRL